jgi:pimeloyl-ACP methyl ester carboxylesterase
MMHTYPHPMTRNIRLPSFAQTLQAIGFVLLRILTSLAVVLLAVPVALLPVGTAVPAFVWVLFAIVDVALVVVLIRFARTRRIVIGALVGFAVVAALAVVASQAFAATPPIVGANGKPIPGSIAVMEKVELGGSEQWITIRGKNVDKPVLLYLGIGGPGAGGFPASALTLAPLEEHFVVVNWDQPGTGKSYHAAPIATLSVERFVSDAHELTQLLRARFHQDKIYVLGLSWGTILGTKLVQQYPDLFYAYVGTGQMVNTTENDRMGYALALKIAADRGETATLDTLHRNGPPPYAGHGMAMKYAVYNNVLFDYMGSPRLEQVLVLVPQFAREYGLVDKVNFARGLIESFPVVYPQLRDLDFTTQAARLDVPMYFLVGRRDVNAMASLVERYYKVLDAPHKELIWLDSGHGAGPEEIVDALVNHVLVTSRPGPAK